MHTNETGDKAVEYSKVVAVLVEAMKEQQNLIDQQGQELDALRQQVNGMNLLEARLQLLERSMSAPGEQTVQVSR